MQPQQAQPVRPAAFIAGLLLAIALGFAIPYSEMFLKGSRLAYSHLPVGPLFILLVLVGGYNRVASRVKPAWALTRTEALLIYAMLLAVAALGAADFAGWVLSVPTAWFYYANPGNKWDELFWRYIPRWIHPDPETGAITALYEGLRRGETIPWGAWAGPLAAWTAFAFLFLGTWLCWGMLLRGRWMDSEKLQFPLAEVPLALAGSKQQAGAESILGSRLMWIGFAIPAFFHTFNSLNRFVPGLPQMRIHDIDVGSAFVQPPWNVLSNLRIYVLFAVIGIAYLLTSEISLGMWFWHWFVRGEKLLLAAVGATPDRSWLGKANLARCQEVGAFCGLVAFLLWTSRREFWGRLRRSLARGVLIREEPTEPLPYFLALLGFLICFAGLVVWCLMGGATIGGTLFFLLIFLVTQTAMARLVNAGGVIFVEANFMPQDIMGSVAGTANISKRTQTVIAPLGMMFFFEQQGILMPYLMDSMRIGRVGRVKGGTYLAAVLLAFFALVGAVYYMLIRLAYTRGGQTLDSWFWRDGACWPWNFLAGHLNTPTTPDLTVVGLYAGGAAFMILMLLAQRQFLWWPVHPLGFLMGSTYTMGVMWFSWLTGWLTKALVQHYGGFRLYHRLRPFFLGMVVGELTTAALWLVIDGVAGYTGHNLYPAF